MFFRFHLLGDWREKTADRALSRLLHLPDKEIGHRLGVRSETDIEDRLRVGQDIEEVMCGNRRPVSWHSAFHAVLRLVDSW